jgi:HAD superfamily hydrolase (TIGR01509 family)
MHRFEAILWDLDGTLVDSEPLHRRAILGIFGELGVDTARIDDRDFVGRSEFDFWTHFREVFDLGPAVSELIARKDVVYAAIVRGELRLMPGVRGALDAFRGAGLPMAIASGSTPRAIRAALDEVGVAPYFRELVSSLDPEVPRSKPHPDVFLAAARRLGVAPARCLVIEDAEWGVKAAKAANMRVLVVPNDATRGHDLSEADWVLPSLTDLPADELLRS